MSELYVPCPVHPEVEAPWRCLDCELYHCEKCVRHLEAGTTSLEVCRDCGGVVARVAKALPPPEVELWDALALLQTPESLIMTMGLALPAWLIGVPLPLLPTIFLAIYFAGVSGYVLSIINHIARGFPGLPTPSDAGTGLGGAVARGVVVALVVLGPALIYAQYTELTTVGEGIVALLLTALGLTWAPAALCAVILQGTVLAAWWVPQWLAVVRAHPEEYLRTAAAFSGAGLAWIGLTSLLYWLCGFIPFFGRLVAATITTHLLWVPAMLVAVYLRRHADDLGLILPGRLLAPPPKPPPALR